MFKNHNIFVNPEGIAERRLKILQNQVTNNQGSLIDDLKKSKKGEKIIVLLEDSGDLTRSMASIPDNKGFF